ncbi:HEAT repeat domain-containing protein [Myroides odoratimimus]|uniref:HEAT repeat domain-containing protein n=1 Tax=Myroides odoratimimus TaxID=76832 RepID=UPI001CE1998E|nr:hypothetical protein [Myroides odoratimimus]MCA4806537.1 hypothetical protein [Myroides odoratimimus]
MAKVLKESIEDLKLLLESSKAPERRKAAKLIGEFGVVDLGDSLYQAYLKESKNLKAWETQCIMIKAIGKIKYKNVLPHLESILEENQVDDMITHEVALAYVRINRKSIKDISPILKLLKEGNLSVLSGALAVLTFDDIIPEKEDMYTVIDAVNLKKSLIKEQHEVGSFDPREYLLSAMSKWDRKDPKIINFIEECSKDEYLGKRYNLIEKVRKGKKVYAE